MSNSQFNICSGLLNLNIESSVNYTNLPYIMSGLNVSSSPPPQLSCAKTPIKPDDHLSQELTFPVAGPSLKPNEFPTNVRSLPPRLAKYKENSLSSNLLRLKRRSIMKPKKLNKVISIDLNEIKKIYTKNEVPNTFKSTSLETIFEEPLSGKHPLGKKKLRRSLSCSDGINVTKTRIKNRRQRVKKVLGKRFALKKISLDEFYERLNSTAAANVEAKEFVHTNKTVSKDIFQINAMETYTDEEAGFHDEDDADA